MGPIGEECKSCHFFESWGLDGFGHCMRFPPTIPPHMVIDQASPRFDVTPIEFEKHEWLAPIVSEDNWCGEHKMC